MRYIVEIYIGNDDAAIRILESDQPFLTISVGDKINSIVSEEHGAPYYYFEVTGVEHVLWETVSLPHRKTTNITHKLVVRVREVEY